MGYLRFARPLAGLGQFDDASVAEKEAELAALRAEREAIEDQIQAVISGEPAVTRPAVRPPSSGPIVATDLPGESFSDQIASVGIPPAGWVAIGLGVFFVARKFAKKGR